MSGCRRCVRTHDVAWRDRVLCFVLVLVLIRLSFPARLSLFSLSFQSVGHELSRSISGRAVVVGSRRARTVPLRVLRNDFRHVVHDHLLQEARAAVDLNRRTTRHNPPTTPLRARPSHHPPLAQFAITRAFPNRLHAPQPKLFRFATSSCLLALCSFVVSSRKSINDHTSNLKNVDVQNL